MHTHLLLFWMKRLMLISAFLFAGATRSTSQEIDAYRAGVQAYLDGKNEAAVSYLEQALRKTPSNEKAKQLLLKVYLKTARLNYEKKDFEKVRSLIRQSNEFLPKSAELESLAKSLPPSVEKSPPMENRSQERKEAGPRPGKEPLPQKPKPAVAKAEAVPAFKITQIPVSISQNPKTTSASLQLLDFSKKKSVAWAFLGFFIALFVVGCAALWYGLWRIQKKLNVQIKKLQSSLEQRPAIEPVSKKEAEPLPVPFQSPQKENGHVHEPAPSPHFPPTVPSAPAQTAVKAAKPAPVRSPSDADRMFIRRQEEKIEEKIMETLVDISPPDRRIAWERIADQAMDLYKSYPEGAINFLRHLSADENLWTRASIVAALARIACVPTLDILFELKEDPHPVIQREVLRSLKQLNLNESISNSYRTKIQQALQQEKEKGEWII